jgi:HSP90 family molecular chaperone
MRSLIKKLLKEFVEIKLNEWEDNISDFGKVVSTLIWCDREKQQKLYLFVGFNTYGELESFSYSFMLLNENNEPLTEYMTEKDEVSKYLPNEIKNKKQIFPIIKNMTRKLLDNNIPKKILRKTVEPLGGDSLKRYEEITNIMVNEYGYKIDETYLDSFGCTVWLLSKKEITDNNSDMNETYEIGGIPNKKQILKDTFDWVLPLLEKK